jgi:hypothetical protein
VKWVPIFVFTLLAVLLGNQIIMAATTADVTVTATPETDVPSGLVLEKIGDTTIRASWDGEEEAVGYLLMVSTVDYPGDPEYQYATAFTGNVTSIDMVGYELDLTAYYFSLWWQPGIEEYSENHATGTIGGEPVAEQLANLNITFTNMVSVATGVLGLLLIVFIVTLAYIRRIPALYVLAGLALILYGFNYYTTSLLMSVIIVLMAITTFGMAAFDRRAK